MKNYAVTAGSSVNQFVNETFETLEQARARFEETVKEIVGSCRTRADLDYCPTDHEMRHAISATLWTVEDGDLVDVIEDSDYYFDSNF